MYPLEDSEGVSLKKILDSIEHHYLILFQEQRQVNMMRDLSTLSENERTMFTVLVSVTGGFRKNFMLDEIIVPFYSYKMETEEEYTETFIDSLSQEYMATEVKNLLESVSRKLGFDLELIEHQED